MMDFIYHFLERIGYTHPLHPPLTHIPIGLVAGALILRLAAIFSHGALLARAAFYCLLIALVFVPTVLFGVTDWQHYFSGAWVFPIKMKVILTGLLLILLAGGVIFGWQGKAETKPFLAICLLSFFGVVGLGYYGGELYVAPQKLCPPAAPGNQEGAKIYANLCAACHPDGGNIFDANLPVRGTKSLQGFNDFSSFMRHPYRPDCKPPTMPAFPLEKLPERQMWELYQYCVNVFGPPKGTVGRDG
jgi:uncharacterized membrane protein